MKGKTMITIHAAELAAAIRPCVQDLWIAHRTEEIEQTFERKLGELAALDAQDESIETLFEKIEEVGAIDEKITARNALIEQLEELMARCLHSLDMGATHLTISESLAGILAPYRENALRQMLTTHGLDASMAESLALNEPQNEVVGMGKASMAA
jgi:predicted transcriptional regulator